MALVVKNLPANAGAIRGFDPWVGKIPWRKKWYPTPVFLPGKFYGQRNFVDYSPWGHKELDAPEDVCICVCEYTHTYTHTHK